MQLLIIMFAKKHISRAGKLNRAYRGKFASFKEMSSKKFDLLRSTREKHRQAALPTRVRRLQHALITRLKSLQITLKCAVNLKKNAVRKNQI